MGTRIGSVLVVKAKTVPVLGEALPLGQAAAVVVATLTASRSVGGRETPPLQAAAGSVLGSDDVTTNVFGQMADEGEQRWKAARVTQAFGERGEKRSTVEVSTGRVSKGAKKSHWSWWAARTWSGSSSSG